VATFASLRLYYWYHLHSGTRATELGLISVDPLNHSGVEQDTPIFVQLISQACRGGILHQPPLMCMVHRHPFASSGENDRTRMPCGARRRHEPSHLPHSAEHMQLQQSSETLTWHVASGSMLLIPGSEGQPAKTAGRNAQCLWAPWRYASRKAQNSIPEFEAFV
jgi:hypothetical protein